MAKKPKPLPLAYTRALIAKEKLAVLQRTAHRIRQLTEAEETPSNNPSPATANPGPDKCLYYTKIIAIAAISVTLYTLFVMLFGLHCRCTCNL
jgi:hypothetical protein